MVAAKRFWLRPRLRETCGPLVKVHKDLDYNESTLGSELRRPVSLLPLGLFQCPRHL